MSGCFALTSAPLSDADAGDATGEVALDLVEQLHRLDEADDLAHRHVVADRDVGRCAGRRGAVVDAGERRLDGRASRPRAPAASAGASACGRRGGAGGRARRAAGGRDGDRRGDRRWRAEDDRRPAAAHLELAEVAALEDRAQAVDQRRAARRRRVDSETAGSGGPAPPSTRRRLDGGRRRGASVVPVGGRVARAHGNRVHERPLLGQAGVGHGLSSSRGVSCSVIRPTGGRRARRSGRRTRTSWTARR